MEFLALTVVLSVYALQQLAPQLLDTSDTDISEIILIPKNEIGVRDLLGLLGWFISHVQLGISDPYCKGEGSLKLANKKEP